MVCFGSWDGLRSQVDKGKGKLLKLNLEVDDELSIDEAEKLHTEKMEKA